MRYAEYRPAPRHAALVERYWFLEGQGCGVPDTIVPDGRVEVIRNSYSLVFSFMTVRDMPISVFPSGAIHCSTTWRPARLDSQQPASHASCWTVDVGCNSMRTAYNTVMIMSGP